LANKRSKQTITLGSGKVYTMLFTGTLPDFTALEAESNLIGWIKGGASVEYAPEFYTAKDDLGMAQKMIITEESVVFKSGIMTWNGETLVKLTNTGRVTESAGKRVLKLGGAQNFDGKKYVIHFVHEDAADGDLRITIVGQNQSGFTLTFAKDAETVVDAEFMALPNLDSEGTLVMLTEETGEAKSRIAPATEKSPKKAPAASEAGKTATDMTDSTPKG
jgi:hypothetical protein